MKKLAIITTHPIQYNAPLFKLLADRGYIQIKVFYTWSQSKLGKLYDPGFAKTREWDIPLLDGYHYEFVDNVSINPGSHHFFGIINTNIIKKIKTFNPDAILVFGWRFYSHLKTLIYFKNKIPLYIKGDSILLDNSLKLILKKTFSQIFLRWVYNHVDKAFYAGQANKKYFLANGLKENQLILTPHCIDNTRFSENKEFYEHEAFAWRRELGVPDHSIVFLFAGKLESKKNPYLLLNAFQSFSEANIRLIIVGNGVLENSLKEKAKSDSRIIFINFQNQSKMPIVYRLGDVFILPSKGPGETWGLSVNEAMACGRPAIVSDACGCCVDLIIKGQTGYSFSSCNLNELKKYMKLFINYNEKMHFRLGTQSHIANYNLENVALAIENQLINKA